MANIITIAQMIYFFLFFSLLRIGMCEPLYCIKTGYKCACTSDDYYLGGDYRDNRGQGASVPQRIKYVYYEIKRKACNNTKAELYTKTVISALFSLRKRNTQNRHCHHR